jgi:hypothetical protein
MRLKQSYIRVYPDRLRVSTRAPTIAYLIKDAAESPALHAEK